MRKMQCASVFAFVILALATNSTTAQGIVPMAGQQRVHVFAEKMCCKGCAQKVSSGLYAIRGVQSVGVDLATHMVTVELPHPNGTTLGRIWHAVEQGEGGPRTLKTSQATYELVPPQNEQEQRATSQMGTTQHIVIDNMHCNGCAQKIAAQLYTIKGVTAVSVDLQRETLIVQTNSEAPISPWLAIDAVANVKERVRMIRGNYGTLAITWAVAATPKSHN